MRGCRPWPGSSRRPRPRRSLWRPLSPWWLLAEGATSPRAPQRALKRRWFRRSSAPPWLRVFLPRPEAGPIGCPLAASCPWTRSAPSPSGPPPGSGPSLGGVCPSLLRATGRRAGAQTPRKSSGRSSKSASRPSPGKDCSTSTCHSRSASGAGGHSLRSLRCAPRAARRRMRPRPPRRGHRLEPAATCPPWRVQGRAEQQQLTRTLRRRRTSPHEDRRQRPQQQRRRRGGRQRRRWAATAGPALRRLQA
mmetsp:Transcript_17470/g.51064  ORF Transcript_17470/g.51064 Transcript_17470/m.51064 type:complete len:249 (-) Transcript_17470:352-1098(-)